MTTDVLDLIHPTAEQYDAPSQEEDDGGANGSGKVRVDVFYANLRTNCR